MKKVILTMGVAAFMAFGLSSCSKCATCTDAAGIVGVEVCQGNAAEDLAYDLAKTTCEAAGGTFE